MDIKVGGVRVRYADLLSHFEAALYSLCKMVKLVRNFTKFGAFNGPISTRALQLSTLFRSALWKLHVSTIADLIETKETPQDASATFSKYKEHAKL